MHVTKLCCYNKHMYGSEFKIYVFELNIQFRSVFHTGRPGLIFQQWLFMSTSKPSLITFIGASLFSDIMVMFNSVISKYSHLYPPDPGSWGWCRFSSRWWGVSGCPEWRRTAQRSGRRSLLWRSDACHRLDWAERPLQDKTALLELS